MNLSGNVVILVDHLLSKTEVRQQPNYLFVRDHLGGAYDCVYVQDGTFYEPQKADFDGETKYIAGTADVDGEPYLVLQDNPDGDIKYAELVWSKKWAYQKQDDQFVPMKDAVIERYEEDFDLEYAKEKWQSVKERFEEDNSRDTFE